MTSSTALSRWRVTYGAASLLFRGISSVYKARTNDYYRIPVELGFTNRETANANESSSAPDESSEIDERRKVLTKRSSDGLAEWRCTRTAENCMKMAESRKKSGGGQKAESQR